MIASRAPCMVKGTVEGFGHQIALPMKRSTSFTRSSPEMSLGRSVSRRAAKVRDSSQVVLYKCIKHCHLFGEELHQISGWSNEPEGPQQPSVQRGAALYRERGPSTMSVNVFSKEELGEVTRMKDTPVWHPYAKHLAPR